jgi:23S rRNA (guanosine2251-2'-O)-methyltransferase
LPIVQITNLTQTIELLKKEGFWIVGLDEDAKQDYTQVDLVRKIAVVVGGEGKGISRLVAEHCDFLVHIPMLGRTESLNASVAAGIMFYEVVRQNRQAQLSQAGS